MTLLRRPRYWFFALTIALRTVAATEPTELKFASVESLSAAIQANPKDSTLYSQRGTAWAEAKEPEKALSDFSRAIELDANNPQTYRSRARFWSDQRETNLAIRDLDRAIELDPDHGATFAQRGLQRALKHRWDDARTDYDKALEMDPGNAEIRFERALFFGSQRIGPAAIEELEAVIQLNPDHLLAYAYRGWLWLMVGKLTQSVEDYSELLKLDPRNASAYMHRAIARMRQREFAKALSDLTMADQLEPRSVNPHDIAFIGRELLRTVNLKLAELDPDAEDPVRLAATYRDRGLANIAIERWNDALKDLNDAIQRDQSSSLAFMARGRIWLQQHEWDQAIADLSMALQLNPRNASLWMDRGIAHAEKNDWVAACDDLTEAVRIDPFNQRAFARRGMAYQSQGNLDLAILDYERVIHGTRFFVHAPDLQVPNEEPAPQDSDAQEAAPKTPWLNVDEPPSVLASKVGLRLNETGDGAFIAENAPDSHDSQGQPGSNQSPAKRSQSLSRTYHAVSLDPIYLRAYLNHANCMIARHEWSKAVEDYQALVSLAPQDPKPYRRIAWLRATCPSDEFRDGAEAVRFAQQAIDRGHLMQDYLTLAAALAEQGDFARALETLAKARDIAIEDSDKQLQMLRQQFKAAEFERLLEDDNDQSASRSDNAVDAAINVCEQSGWKNAKSIEALADAYIRAGRFEDAQSCCDKLYDLTLANIDQTLLVLQQQFETSTPYRASRDDDIRLIEGADEDNFHAKLELLSDEDLLSISGLPAKKLSIAQIRLLSMPPKPQNPTEVAQQASAEDESDNVDTGAPAGAIHRNPAAKEAATLINRGLDHQIRGEIQEALNDFQSAIQLDPRNAAAYNNVAWLRATSPDNRFRNGKEALKCALTACELTDWKNWTHLDSLAAAYAETGDFAAAIQWTETCLELIPFDESESETERLQKNLELFRMNQPIRDSQRELPR